MSFLSEAADDICYRVIDIEDAVELNELRQKKAKKLYLEMLSDQRRDYHSKMELPQLRASVIGHLVDAFWDVFVGNYDQIMAGKRKSDLKKSLADDHSVCFASVKKTNTTKIFTAEKKVRVEIGAYQVMGRVLKALGKATQAYSEYHDLNAIPFIAQRCLSLAWSQEYLAANADRSFNWWVHQILDFVSGMTDDRAIEVSNSINGFN